MPTDHYSNPTSIREGNDPKDPRDTVRPELMPIPRTRLPDEIVRRITTFVLDAGLRPGDRMPSERELMTKLGVGRSSLREAVKTLSAVGVVRVKGGEGMFVADGTTSLVAKPIAWGLLVGEHGTQEVIEARCTVEVAMAGMAACRAVPDDVAALEARLADMRSAIAQPEVYTSNDAAFHLEIARIAGNAILRHVLDTLRHVIRVWMRRTFTGYSEAMRLQSYNEHAPIVDAIRRHDPSAARGAMAAHLDAAAARLLKTIAVSAENGSPQR
jgi:GntR family transcriptional repressor for pyruvate dehydrogenase complex